MFHKLSFFIIFLTGTNVISQVAIPYHQGFENNSFYTDSNIYMDIASPRYPNGSVYPITQQQVITDGEGYSWELSPNHQSGNKSLRLTIHREDHPHNAVSPKSRAEFSIRSKAEKGDTFFYSWRFFVPSNEEFEDHSDGWNIIGQFWETNKILSIEYVDNPSSVSLSRKLLFLLYDPKEKKHSRIHIENGITKGEWNELILKIHWSDKDSISNPTAYGHLEMWINKKPVVSYKYVFGNNDGVHNYFCNLSEDNEISPSQFHFRNIHKENSSMSNHNIKFGQYRANQFGTNSIYFDDLKIMEIFPDNSTRIRKEYCGNSIPLDNRILKIYPVPGATEYIAQFEHDGIFEYAGIGNSTTLNLDYVDFLVGGRTYNVSIRAVGVKNSRYGKSCSITIPSSTKLKKEYCDITVSADHQILEVYKIPGATEYIARFETSGIINYAGMGNSTTLNLNYINFLVPGKTYNVRIRAAGAESSTYGESCSITLPSLSSELIVDLENSRNRKIKEENAFIVYPNPFTHEINIKGITNLKKYKIFDAKGQLILDKETDKNNIDLRHLPDGIYVLYTYDAGFSKKVVKIIKRQ